MSNFTDDSSNSTHYYYLADDGPFEPEVVLPMQLISSFSAFGALTVILSILFSSNKLYLKDSYSSIMYFAISAMFTALSTTVGYPG